MKKKTIKLLRNLSSLLFIVLALGMIVKFNVLRFQNMDMTDLRFNTTHWKSIASIVVTLGIALILQEK